MPGSQRETLNAEEEGVHFEWLAAPAAFSSGTDGRVSTVTAKMHGGNLPAAPLE